MEAPCTRQKRQKGILIAALMVRPDLLVLDEPARGLDPVMEQAFRHCIVEARNRGQTVFLSSHIMSEVEALCDRVGILRDGKLTSGSGRGSPCRCGPAGRRPPSSQPSARARPCARGS